MAGKEQNQGLTRLRKRDFEDAGTGCRRECRREWTRWREVEHPEKYGVSVRVAGVRDRKDFRMTLRFLTL